MNHIGSGIMGASLLIGPFLVMFAVLIYLVWEESKCVAVVLGIPILIVFAFLYYAVFYGIATQCKIRRL